MLQCPHCDYNLTGLPEERCPECGVRFDLRSLRRQLRRVPTPCTPWDHRKRAGRSTLPRVAGRITALARTGAFVIFCPLAFARRVPPVPDLNAAWTFRWWTHTLAIIALFVSVGIYDLLVPAAVIYYQILISAVVMTLLIAPLIEYTSAAALAGLAGSSPAPLTFLHWKYVLYYHSAFLLLSAAGALVFISIVLPRRPRGDWEALQPFAVSLAWWWLSLAAHAYVRARSRWGALPALLICVPVLSVTGIVVGYMAGWVLAGMLW